MYSNSGGNGGGGDSASSGGGSDGGAGGGGSLYDIYEYSVCDGDVMNSYQRRMHGRCSAIVGTQGAARAGAAGVRQVSRRVHCWLWTSFRRQCVPYKLQQLHASMQSTPAHARRHHALSSSKGRQRFHASRVTLPPPPPHAAAPSAARQRPTRRGLRRCSRRAQSDRRGSRGRRGSSDPRSRQG